MANASVLILLANNKLIGVDDHKGRGIILPGGRVEEGETYREAAIRELYEETGISVKLEDTVRLYEGFCGKHYSYIFGALKTSEYKYSIGRDYGAGGVGIYHYRDFLSSKYKAHYDILFETMGLHD